MSFALRRTALACAALALSLVPAAAHATSFDFDSTFNPQANVTNLDPDISNGEIHVTGGTFYNTDSATLHQWDLAHYTFDMNLAVDPSSGPFDPNGSTQAYTGDYTLYFDSTPFATGTVTAQGQANLIINPFFPSGSIDFTTGLLTYVSGAGHDPFPGTSNFTLQGHVGASEGVEFYGTITTTDASAVPLPASATMGLGLIGLLGAAQVARRRRLRTA